MWRIVSAARLCPRFHFHLDGIEQSRVYDSRMAVIHIVLWHFAFVDLRLLGQEIGAEGFLQ